MSSVYKPCVENIQSSNLRNNLPLSIPIEFYETYKQQSNGSVPLLDNDNIQSFEKNEYFVTEITNPKADYIKKLSDCPSFKPRNQQSIFQKLYDIFKLGDTTKEICTNILIIIAMTTIGAVIVGLLMSYVILPQLSKATTENEVMMMIPLVPNGVNDTSKYFKGAIGNTFAREVTVKSVINLHEITKDAVMVEVKQLTNAVSPSGLSNSGALAVKQLHLTGPISQYWLNHLLFSFKNLETIVMNVDKVCEGFDDKSGTDKLKPVELKTLTKITIENSYNCPIMKWGFDLELQSLKIIELSNAVLTSKYYEVFERLLNKTSHTIEGIDISKSYICDECDITELEFENLRYLKITKRLDKDPRYVYESN